MCWKNQQKKKQNMSKVAIIGYGWVGKAMKQLFPVSVVYDPAQVGLIIASDDRYDHVVIDDKSIVNECDIAFIGVPTPNRIGATVPGAMPGNPLWKPNEEGEGVLDTSIVEEIITWCECDLIVIRSTVNPGDCDRWSKQYNKNIVMQPEYLGETPAHPLLDPKVRPFLVIGGELHNRRKLINLYATVYNANTTIRQVTNLEAEIIKLSENRAIAFKVAQCQELYDVCELAGVDYYTIRETVYSDDPRFNLWWSLVFPDKRGFNSKCIPKDIYAWCAWAESLGYEPKITRAMLEKNKEWINNA